MQGPGIFLAQFISDEKPFNNLKDIVKWAKEKNYKAVQLPVWEKEKCFDVQKAATSKIYADEIRGIVEEQGLVISDIASHLLGQLIAIHPAYNTLFDGFAPAELKGDIIGKKKWAEQQLYYTAKACKNLGISACATFSGALLWHTFYPWPQRPAGLVEDGFNELAKRWLPILNAFDEQGVDLCFEIHAGEDLCDGITYEMFLEKVQNHSRACLLYDPSHFVLQCLDYLSYIDIYHQRIKMFHVKDAEFNPTGKQGVYGGFQDWKNRAGRFRSLGDGQVDFKSIFSKLTQYGYKGWAVLEWECCLKDGEDGAREGSMFIQKKIITLAKKNFDNFVKSSKDEDFNKKILGLN